MLSSIDSISHHLDDLPEMAPAPGRAPLALEPLSSINPNDPDCPDAWPWGFPNRIHQPLPPHVLEELRAAYVGGLREVSANLNRIAAQTGIPKKRLQYHARRHGWHCQTERRPWKPAELEYLQEKLGSVSLTQIARGLKRSVISIQVKAMRLKRSLRLTAGYNVSNLADVFGVHHTRVESWARRGLLGKQHGRTGHGGNIRFTEANVIRFIRSHACEYDLGRVDQTWFKSMVFGSLSGFGGKGAEE